MPIYEYKCKDCGQKFEVFTFSHADSTIECQECGSENTERMMSGFASSGSATGSSCRPGSPFS